MKIMPRIVMLRDDHAGHYRGEIDAPH
jgi:hypothetical protein